MNKSMNGSLFVYSTEHRLCAFSTPQLKNGCLIFIPGLTDGLLSLEYLYDLKQILDDMSITLVQPILRSSYMQYGISSLETDCQDIEQLINYLKQEYKYKQYFLMGHSTGCQDIIYYLKHSKQVSDIMITCCILQGAVSDREYMFQNDSTKEYLQYIEDHHLNESDYMPKESDDAPITVSRYLSLTTKLSEEDMFSTDISDVQMESIFKDISTNILFLYCGNDQYVPDYVNKYKYVHRVENAIPNCNAYLIGGASHEVTEPSPRRIFIQIIFNHISNILKQQYMNI